MSEPQAPQPPRKPDPEGIARALAATVPHEPTGDSLNLSRRPFLNSRPVVRTALLLWLAGAFLLLVNISSFWDYLSGSEDKRAQIARREAEIARRETAVHQLETRLDSYDLTANNVKVDFLNEKIAQRTFSWSLLLERLTDVMPNNVRLKRLQPVTGQERGSASRTRTSRSAAAGGTSGGFGAGNTIPLSISGDARSNEALLKFQSNLFAHPAFSYPNLLQQSLDDQTNLIGFELSARYVPGGMPAEVPALRAAPPKPPISPPISPAISATIRPTASATARPIARPMGASR